MLKSILVLLASVSFVATANAAKEIQINGTSTINAGGFGLSGGGGTAGGITLADDGTNDSTDFGLGAEVYFGMSENLQVGGIVSYGTAGDGDLTAISLGGLVRYNLSTELRDSVFVGGGLRYTTIDADAGGDADNIALLLSVGKRYALSETLTWTPNVTVALNVGGDIDEGHTIALNLLSFSGFMD